MEKMILHNDGLGDEDCTLSFVDDTYTFMEYDIQKVREHINLILRNLKIKKITKK